MQCEVTLSVTASVDIPVADDEAGWTATSPDMRLIEQAKWWRDDIESLIELLSGAGGRITIKPEGASGTANIEWGPA